MLLFILSKEDLLIYELKEEPFSIIHIKTILKSELFNINQDIIKYFYCFKYEGYIMFNFFSLKQIKLFSFNPDSIEFTLKKAKNYSNDRFNKYFYYMKKTKKFIIFRTNEVNIYDNLFQSQLTLIEPKENLDDDSSVDLIHYCKELENNLLCIIFNHSISLYNLEIENVKCIGYIKDINPKSVKLIFIK